VQLQKIRNGLNPRKEKALIQEADTLLHFDKNFFTDGKEYTKDPLLLDKRRDDVAALIEKIQKRL
jgi:hypothetical protein